jgi:hypothetical protein
MANIDITFYQSELPPLEVRRRNEAFMIIDIYGIRGIK